MTEEEKNDLLVKLGFNMESLCERMGSVESELKKRQCLLHEDQIHKLENTLDPQLCSKNTEKIRTIEKLTWVALIAGISLIVKSFWSAITT